MRLLPIAPLLCLAACAGDGAGAPSLLPRAVERQPIEAPEAAREEAGTADPALAPRLAGIVAAAEAGHRRFEAERRAAAAVFARAAGRAPGVGAAIAAETARSALVAARGPVNDAAAALDALRTDPAYAAAANRASIEEAAAKVAALAAAEAGALDGSAR